MKKAFSMLTAIVFILIIGVLFAFTLSLLASSTQRTSDHYLHNQAQMLARGAVEYAILATQGHDISTTNNCLNSININYNNTFDINVTIYYIGNGFPPGCTQVLSNTLQTDESNASAVIDVKVTLNPTVFSGNSPITYIRRTIQKL